MRQITASELDSLRPDLNRSVHDLHPAQRTHTAGLSAYVAAMAIAVGLIIAWVFLAAF